MDPRLVRRDGGPLGERWDLARGAAPSRAAGAGRGGDEGEVLADARAAFASGGIALTADAAAALGGRAAPTLAGQESIEIAPGVRMMPVRTPTLPPAAHTNAFVVGTKGAVLVEPASPHDDELDHLVEWVGALEAAEGIEVEEILLTHHHPDHVGGARALREALGVPIAAHAETASRLPKGVTVDREIRDGDVIALGDVSLRAVHTPGHAPGHLCFVEERSRAAIAGDMVAGIGTILIEPGDGDMEVYLDSLRRMIELGASVLAPAHGGMLRPPNVVLERYVAHRLERERRVLAALVALGRPAAVVDLLPSAYADVPAAIWPLAALSTEAHLVKLEREGKVAKTARGWQAAADRHDGP
jgi:glyoxylase-like metal-dependent hydrolase (beta-lactamase superfamily II)